MADQSSTSRPLVVTLPPLHASQAMVAEHPARFKVLAAGRRWGKSRLAGALSLATAARGGRAWWVAPSFPQSSTAWRELKALASPIPGRVVREDARRIGLPGGGEIVVKSADAPNSMLGEGLDLVVLDEAAYHQEDVWTRVLRPTLSDRQGRALLISTPAGPNWYHGLWLRGQEGRPDWASWRFPTVDSPFIAAEEIEEARATLPAAVFCQEYEASFVSIEGGVFRGVAELATATRQDRAAEGHHYVVGVDWGRTHDATVFAVFDTTAQALVFLDRLAGVEFPQQRARLRGLVDRFRPVAILAEQNSIGLPQLEELRRDGLRVQGFVTTNASKAELVDRAVLLFERRAVTLIPDPMLLEELNAFVGERLPSGLMRYGAAHGHDDCVMALLLALHAGAAARSSSAIGAFGEINARLRRPSTWHSLDTPVIRNWRKDL